MDILDSNSAIARMLLALLPVFLPRWTLHFANGHFHRTMDFLFFTIVFRIGTACSHGILSRTCPLWNMASLVMTVITSDALQQLGLCNMALVRT
jgi:hypothetical protein